MQASLLALLKLPAGQPGWGCSERLLCQTAAVCVYMYTTMGTPFALTRPAAPPRPGLCCST